MEREVSKERQTRPIHDGTLIRFSTQLSPEPPEPQNRGSISRRQLAFHLGLQKFPRQTNHPGAGCCRYAFHARSTNPRSLPERLAIH
jgi:hypothetical protein